MAQFGDEMELMMKIRLVSATIQPFSSRPQAIHNYQNHTRSLQTYVMQNSELREFICAFKHERNLK